MLTFMQSVFVGFAVCMCSSFFVFFAKRLSVFLAGTLCFLSGVVFLLLKKDAFINSYQGLWAAGAIVLIFTLAFLVYRFVRVSDNALLPLMGFMTLAMSTDLIMILMGLSFFGVSFALLARQRDKKNAVNCFLKTICGLLSFSLGTAVVYCRIGTLSLSDLRYQLSMKSDDEWLMYGFGLLCLGVVVLLYGAALSLKKDKK